MSPVLRRIAARLRRQFAVPSEARAIYLIAAAGQPNFGDEFITRAWLDWLAANHPRAEVWLDCMEPGRAAHLFRDTHPNLRTTNTLWQTAHAGNLGETRADATRLESLVANLGSPKNDFGLRELRRMNSLHLLGGGYINSVWPNNLSIVAAMTAVKQLFGVKIFATGQGLMPHDQQTRDWLARQLSMFDFAEARDAPSAETFRVHAGTDDAFLAFANRRPIYSVDEDLPSRMILVQGDDMFDDSRTPNLTELVSRFVESAARNDDVGFAEGIPPEDMRFAGDHVRQGARAYPFMRMWDEGFPARSGQEWLTSRFHFHLLAAAAGADGEFVVARDGYYDVKHALLRELGTGWRPADPSTNATEPTEGQLPPFPETARSLGRAKAQLAVRLYGRR